MLAMFYISTSYIRLKWGPSW